MALVSLFPEGREANSLTGRGGAMDPHGRKGSSTERSRSTPPNEGWRGWLFCTASATASLEVASVMPDRSYGAGYLPPHPMSYGAAHPLTNPPTRDLGAIRPGAGPAPKSAERPSPAQPEGLRAKQSIICAGRAALQIWIPRFPRSGNPSAGHASPARASNDYARVSRRGGKRQTLNGYF